MKNFLTLIALILLTSTLNASSQVDQENQESSTFKLKGEKRVYIEEPDPLSGLTFSELVQLSKTPNPSPELEAKVQKHLSTVFVDNKNKNATLDKPYIRVGHWNVERGFQIKEIVDALTKNGSYVQRRLKNLPERKKDVFRDELKSFSESDIICFHELDIGMKRTDYRDNLMTITDALGWNSAYATEFIEVGPLFQNKKVSEREYRGLHGSAIVSKYPIASTKYIDLPTCYDWYSDEAKKRLSPVEHVRRFTAKSVFDEKLTRKEVRHGGRQAIVADVKLPNSEVITVVATHLEDRAFPDCRRKQFITLLDSIKDIKTPIVLAGDFNTSTTDTKPTSVNKEIFKRLRDPDYIARTVGSFFIPSLPVLSGFAAVATSKLLQYKDPAFPHVPIIFPNHERKLFKYMKKFRFADGTGFDLDGDRKRSFGNKRGLLANSNQRHWKGFKSTYRLEEPRIIAYFKLDWFFVKPAGNKFKPFYGRTLKTFNKSVEGGISDHNPIIVDLEVKPGVAESIVKARMAARKNWKTY